MQVAPMIEACSLDVSYETHTELWWEATWEREDIIRIYLREIGSKERR